MIIVRYLVNRAPGSLYRPSRRWFGFKTVLVVLTRRANKYTVRDIKCTMNVAC